MKRLLFAWDYRNNCKIKTDYYNRTHTHTNILSQWWHSLSGYIRLSGSVPAVAQLFLTTLGIWQEEFNLFAMPGRLANGRLVSGILCICCCRTLSRFLLLMISWYNQASWERQDILSFPFPKGGEREGTASCATWAAVGKCPKSLITASNGCRREFYAFPSFSSRFPQNRSIQTGPTTIWSVPNRSVRSQIYRRTVVMVCYSPRSLRLLPASRCPIWSRSQRINSKWWVTVKNNIHIDIDS